MNNTNHKQVKNEGGEMSWLKVFGIIFAGIVGIAVIAGVLAYISLTNAKDTSYDARQQSDLNQIKSSIFIYKDRNGEFPEKLSDLEDSTAISAVPTSPETGAKYEYTLTEGELRFCLGTCLRENDKSSNDYSNQCVNRLNLACGNRAPYAISGDFRF